MSIRPHSKLPEYHRYMEGFDKNPIIIKGYEDREVVIEAVKEMIEELDGRFME